MTRCQVVEVRMDGPYTAEVTLRDPAALIHRHGDVGEWTIDHVTFRCTTALIPRVGSFVDVDLTRIYEGEVER